MLEAILFTIYGIGFGGFLAMFSFTNGFMGGRQEPWLTVILGAALWPLLVVFLFVWTLFDR